MTVTEHVDSVREFNRFYTNVIGVLHEGLLDSAYSLTEARVLFELAQRDVTELAELRRTIDVDAGYLSRILARFEADGLVTRRRSRADGRRQQLRLTARGRRAFAALDRQSSAQVADLLGSLPAGAQRRLVASMHAIRDVLGTHAGEGGGTARAVVLRPLAAGDYGWVVERHGALYAQEFGWDETFEALFARIVADFIERRDPRRDAAWVAEVDGERAGCVFCVRKDAKTAQLRLLLVDPSVRGTGIGTRLVDECLRFARRAGYRRMVLWTNDVLRDARRIYDKAGFALVEEEPHHSFGHDLVGQTLALDL
jgi:DNA-binding MarR family transcriptional regulator/N-acetylglutamate synthase-like GNAT family acetyltransferase